MEPELKNALIANAIEREALRGRAVNTTAILATVNLAGITVDDKGNVLGADEAIRALQATRPELFTLTAGAPHDPAQTRATEQATTEALTGPPTLAQRMDAAIRGKVGGR